MTKDPHKMILDFKDFPNGNKYWKWFFTIGVLLIVLGIFAIGYAKWATEFTIILLGYFLMGAGILQLISSFYTTRWKGFSLSLCLGLFYILIGAICVFKPIDSALGIGLLIAALLLMGGLYRFVTAVRHRFDNWGWVVFNGLIAFLLGILILAEWPSSVLWLMGVFIGIDLLLMGCYWISLSFLLKK